MKTSLVTSATAIGLAALLAGCSGGSGTTTQTPVPSDSLLTTTDPATKAIDEVRWGYQAQLPTLDPAKSTQRNAGQVIGNLCDTLLLVQPDYSVTSNLAALTREGSTTLVLTLKKATFWDGAPVTADDVVYSLKRNLDPAVGSEWASYFENVADITARNAEAVQITMKKPDILFEKALGTLAGAVMERKFAEAAGDTLGSVQGNLMCSGPFMYASSTASSMTLKRNPNYWNADRKPLTETLVVNYLVDGATANAALSAGDVHGMYDFPANATESLQASNVGAVYFGQSTSQFSYVMGNNPDNPLSDIRLRQALSLALDRTAVAKKVFGEAGTAATSFFGSAIATQFDGNDAAVLAPGPKLEEGKKLVQDVIAEKGKPRPIIFSYTSGVGPEVGQMMTYLQQVATGLGLEVELLDEAPNVWFDRIMAAPTKPSFDVTFSYGGATISDPAAVLVNYESGARGNYTNYSSPAVNEALSAGRESSDDQVRARLALAAQQDLARDFPTIPVVNVAQLLFMNKAVTGAPASSAANGFPWASVVGGR